MTDARAEILARIEGIPRAAAAVPVPRGYRRAGAGSPAERVDLFCERVSDYRAEVRRTPAATAGEVVDAECVSRSASRVGVPTGLPATWRPRGAEIVVDTGLTAHELDALDGVVTGCTVAVAETGTIILTAGPAEGRRALTLVPDLHVCIVEAAQVVELVPEAVERVANVVRTKRSPVTLISGPSATSDIELSRVEGVHGPRTLVVILVDPD